MKTIQQIKERFLSANIVEQIISVNVIFFILTYLFEAISGLMKWDANFIYSWFSLSANFSDFVSKPWSIISYGFLHSGIWHILLNSLMLFYIGYLFLSFFSKKQFLIYYFLGILVGGIIFILSYNFFPALKNKTSYLVGASAGVTAILIGLATKVPNYALNFRFIGSIKLWYIAVAFIVLDIMQIPISNTGGHLAHLGGALSGFILTSQLNDGKNLSDFFSSLFKSKKQKSLKTVYKKNNPSRASLDKNMKQRKIDAILDKISKSGYETLTQEEKDFLFSAGKK